MGGEGKLVKHPRDERRCLSFLIGVGARVWRHWANLVCMGIVGSVELGLVLVYKSGYIFL